ncbi:Exodeoxyribonuclease VII small subunit [Thermoactinomyces sp. DSM 45891]|uniref:exodeoxyribonuclease VII small subunit n=1 Tax=Thermoactinomyces sp. DSM 45891 TaxID=1761907 RepID=UPI00091DB858|nr:exodeoxyribonuclease VII small subunit [Thermoactinomyces sp. DSM 45891]SFX52293.1 Exodeoxyribonuclease VII small subunit [Thermoactinomyces sp. DSM 45891]
MSNSQSVQPSEPTSFEEAMERLEEVVKQLEQGEVPLDQAIRLFAEGNQLAFFCREKLDWAEQQVEMLVQENGEWKKKPFQNEEEL